MANAEEIIEAVEHLQFPQDEFAVFGGACLALRDIREARDLEVFTSRDIENRLARRAGWHPRSFQGRNLHLVGLVGDVEVQIFSEWDYKGWQPDIASYLRQPEMVQGVPCMPFDQLLAWKQATARPKDLRDLELVKAWWSARS